MPRRNRNPGSGKPPFNGPARGGPAAGEGRGGPAKGAGKGDGWGGSAGGPREAITAETARTMTERRDDPTLIEEREARLKALRDKIYHLAHSAERQETQLSAAIAYLDREEGKPIARNLNVNTDDLSRLSDADLAAELARLERAAREASPGAAAQGDPPGPGGVVH